MLLVQGHTLRSLLQRISSESTSQLSCEQVTYSLPSLSCPLQVHCWSSFSLATLSLPSEDINPSKVKKKRHALPSSSFFLQKRFPALCHHFSTDRWPSKYKMLAREFIPFNIKLPSPLWAHGDGGGGLSKIHIYYARLASKIITDSHVLDRVHSWYVRFWLAFLRHHHSPLQICSVFALLSDTQHSLWVAHRQKAWKWELKSIYML